MVGNYIRIEELWFLLMRNTYYYNQLNEKEKQLYESFVQAMFQRKRSVPITNSKKAGEIFEHVLDDYPELFYVSRKLAITGLLVMNSLNISYEYSANETENLSKQVDVFVETFIKEHIKASDSDYDKVRIIHDYLKEQVFYDEAAAGSNHVSKYRDSHTMIGPLLHKKCVCSGFAQAMKYMCEKLGIECLIVSGKGHHEYSQGSHAWNIVNINGCYQHIDVTWDNQFALEGKIPNYDYFNVSDEVLWQDHRWDRNHYPPCTTDSYNYFKMNQSVMESVLQLERFIKEQCDNEEEYILFQVKKGSALDKELPDQLGELCERAFQKCKYIRIMSYQCQWTGTTGVYMISPRYQ